MFKISDVFSSPFSFFVSWAVVLFTVLIIFVKGMALKNINTQELIKYQADPAVLIVDVREKKEIEETGILPGAINIPSKEVAEALGSMSFAKFQEVYGKPRPDMDGTIVFSCRSGMRSTAATQTALKLGYLNSLNYSGGWLGWEAHLKSQN